MTIASRPYHPDQDGQSVLDLLTRSRSAAQFDRHPTRHRLELLLTSRLWEPERDALVLRESDSGSLVGFVMLWRRGREVSHSGIEIVSHPAALRQVIEGQALTLAIRRTTERTQELGCPTFAGYSGGSEETEFFSLLERFGFVRQEGYNIYMGCPLETLAPFPIGPAGYTIRPLVGEAELPAYGAIYGFAPVTRGLRLELLRDPDYAHFVAVAQDGALVGFCECSVSRGEWGLGGRHTGWIDYVGTRPEHQGKGIGQALLRAAMRQMRQWGAKRVALVTMGANERAQRVYRKVGMDVLERDYGYVLEIVP